jgi:exosortase
MSQVETQPDKTESNRESQPVGRRRPKAKPAARAKAPRPAPKPAPVPVPLSQDAAWRLVFGAAALAAGAWAYLPTLRALVEAWEKVPNYSHGYLVAPLAILFLVLRRSRFPKADFPAYGLGGGLLALAFAMRYASGRFFLEFLDAWSILPWLAGVVAIVCGRRTLWWAFPSIGFLWFMVPLPFGAETAMSLPLQRIATKISTFGLQVIGVPAFSEGNVIHLSEGPPLEVAQACSGLGLFMTFVALGYAYVVLVRRTWWEKGLLLSAIVPIAIVSNAARIIGTGIACEYTELDQKLVHDNLGLAMIPLAAALFALLLWYMSKLIREEEVMEMAALVREGQTSR